MITHSLKSDWKLLIAYCDTSLTLLVQTSYSTGLLNNFLHTESQGPYGAIFSEAASPD